MKKKYREQYITKRKRVGVTRRENLLHPALYPVTIALLSSYRLTGGEIIKKKHTHTAFHDSNRRIILFMSLYFFLYLKPLL